MLISDRKRGVASQCRGGNRRRPPVPESNVGHDYLGYEVKGIRIFGREMGEPAGCTDPDRPIRRRQKGIGVAILPDQSLLTAIVSPLSLEQNVSTSVRSHPDRSVRSAADKVCLIGVEPMIVVKMLRNQLFTLPLKPRNTPGIEIGDPDRAIGGFRHAQHRIVPEAIVSLVTAPGSIVEAQQAA